VHESLEPFHERMEEIHRELEPFHREMDRLHHRLQAALRAEIGAILRAEMASVVRADAPFTEAAERVSGAVDVHVDGRRLRLDGSAGDVADILVDLLEPHRVGATEGELRAAARRAAERVVAFELER
jgi:hypothetical protein